MVRERHELLTVGNVTRCLILRHHDVRKDFIVWVLCTAIVWKNGWSATHAPSSITPMDPRVGGYTYPTWRLDVNVVAEGWERKGA